MPENGTYIASSYVKFVESGGARVVPILADTPADVVGWGVAWALSVWREQLMLLQQLQEGACCAVLSTGQETERICVLWSCCSRRVAMRNCTS